MSLTVAPALAVQPNGVPPTTRSLASANPHSWEPALVKLKKYLPGGNQTILLAHEPPVSALSLVTSLYSPVGIVSRLPVACAHVGIAPDRAVGGVVEKSGRYDGTADGMPFGHDLRDESRVPGGYGGP